MAPVTAAFVRLCRSESHAVKKKRPKWKYYLLVFLSCLEGAWHPPAHPDPRPGAARGGGLSGAAHVRAHWAQEGGGGRGGEAPLPWEAQRCLLLHWAYYETQEVSAAWRPSALGCRGCTSTWEHLLRELQWCAGRGPAAGSGWVPPREGHRAEPYL